MASRLAVEGSQCPRNARKVPLLNARWTCAKPWISMLINAPDDARRLKTSANNSLRKLCAVLFALTLCVTGAWATLTFDVLRNTALVQHGETTLKLIDQWIALIKRIQPLSDQEKLQFTNNFFNSAVQWVTDQDNWQQEDYWACLLYTSPSPRDKRQSRMPSSA